MSEAPPPEALRDEESPDDNLAAQKSAAAASSAAEPAWRPRIPRRRAALAVLLALCLGLGLGVGLGVGLAGRGSSHVTSTAPAYTHVITATVTLQGYTAATFGAAAQAAFISAVARSSSVATSAVSIVSITDAAASGRRRALLQGGVTVTFSVSTAGGADDAAVVSAALGIALSSSAFLNLLNAALAAAGLQPVASVTVDVAPTIFSLMGGADSAILFDGAVQKGPFIFGSTIIVSELTANLSSRGVTHLTQTSNALGQFTLMGGVTSPIVDILGDGFFFDEIGGALSSAPIKLRAFANLTQSPSVTVNLLTTLQTPRLKSLMLAGASFSAAYTQSQQELLSSFGIGSAIWPTLGSLAQMNLNGTSDSSGVMLAISALVLQSAYIKAGGSAALVPGQLSLLLSQMAFELNAKGAINSTAFKTGLAAASAALQPSTVSKNLLTYYAGQGATITLPPFADWVDADNSGNLPHRTTVAATAFSFPATVGNTPGATLTSATITVAGLPAGVRALVRLYATWPATTGSGCASLGTFGVFAYTMLNSLQTGGGSVSFTAGLPALSKNGGSPVAMDACPASASGDDWQAAMTCSGNFNSSAYSTAVNGDTFTLSTIAGDYGWFTSIVLSIGVTSATWAVSVAAPTPSAFSFQAVTVEPMSTPTSSTVTVAGLPSGTSAVLSVGCSPTLLSNGATAQIMNRDLLQCPPPPGSPMLATGGNYSSIPTVTLNGSPAISVTIQSSGNQGPPGSVNRVVQMSASAPTTLAGVQLGSCQLVVKNGDTISLSLAAPDNAGVIGLVQTIPVAIGTLQTYWKVTVRTPTVGRAHGLTAPTCPTCLGYFAGYTPSCTVPSPYPAGGSKGDLNSLYYAIPFQTAAGPSLILNYAAVGVTFQGNPNSMVSPDSVYIALDSGGVPSNTPIATTTQIYNYQAQQNNGGNPLVNAPVATSLFGLCALPGQGSGAVCNPAISVLPGTGGPYNMSMLETTAMEVVFPSQPQLASSTTHWLVLHFPTNGAQFAVSNSGQAGSAGSLLPQFAGASKSWSTNYQSGTCAPLLYLLS